MKKEFQSSWFGQYLKSYLIVFLIPFIILFLLVNGSYMSGLHDEAENKQESGLLQASLKLNEDLMSIRSIGNQINYSNAFSPNILRRDDLSQALEVLNLYRGSQPAISGIYIISKTGTMVYSTRGTISMHGLLNNVQEFDVVDGETEILLEHLSTPEEGVRVYDLATIREDQESQSAIYFMPLKTSNQEIGTIAFTLNLRPFVNALRIWNNPENLTFVLDENDRPIIEISEQDIHFSDIPWETINQEGRQRVMIAGQPYFIYILENTLTGWTIANAVPMWSFYKPAIKALVLFVVIAALALLIGYHISVYFAKQNYQPLETLVGSFDSEIEVKDEWEFLEENINRVQQESEILSSRISEQQQYLQSEMLLRLFDGRFEDKKEMIDRLNEIGLPLHFKQFQVSVIQMTLEQPNPDQLAKIDHFTDSINSVFHDSFIVYGAMPFTSNNQVIILWNANNLSDEKITRIQKNMIQKADIALLNPKMGIGKIYNDLSSINKSFIEASSALDYIMTDNKEICLFEEINPEKHSTKLSDVIQFYKEDSLLLEQSLKQGNRQVAKSIVSDLYARLKTGYYNTFTLEMLGATIVSHLMGIATIYDISLQETFDNINDLSDIQKVINVLNDQIDKICQGVQEKQFNENLRIETQAVDYVYRHFTDPSISLEEIASKLNISTSYVSKLIKEETGQSFTSILQELRMNLFKQLLVETERPIKDLVSEIGYNDVSNFTRKFRQENDLTPSQYRKKHQKIE